MYIRRKGSAETHVTSRWRSLVATAVRDAAPVAQPGGKELARYRNIVGRRAPIPTLEWSVRHRQRWAGELLMAPV
jgi:hypothetical protein